MVIGLSLACITPPSPTTPISTDRAETATTGVVAATPMASLPPTPDVSTNTPEPPPTSSQRKPSPTVAKPDAQSPATRPLEIELRFLALGDSYTIGESVAVEERWPVQLVQLIRGQGIKIAGPFIVAETGWTTVNLSAAIEGHSLEGPFDIVTLMIGVNNQFRGLDAVDYRVGFLELLGTAIGLAGGEPGNVVVVSIPDYGVTPFAATLDGVLISREIDAFNAVNRAEAINAGAVYVDVTDISRRAKTDLSLLAFDGLHPSGKMYRLWAELIQSALTPRIAIIPAESPNP